MRYLKIFGYEWLEGSIRKDLDSAGRGIWADILALASLSRRIGYLERSVGIPYTDQEIADKFNVNIKELQKVIATCILEGRLQRENDTNTLYVKNWDRYQDYPLGSEPTNKKADKSKNGVLIYNPAYQKPNKKGTGKIPDIG